MNTGIFIRALIDGKWESVDIGDCRLPDIEVVKWLQSSKHNHFAEKCVMLLLGRDQSVVKESANDTKDN